MGLSLLSVFDMIDYGSGEVRDLAMTAVTPPVKPGAKSEAVELKIARIAYGEDAPAKSGFALEGLRFAGGGATGLVEFDQLFRLLLRRRDPGAASRAGKARFRRGLDRLPQVHPDDRDDPAQRRLGRRAAAASRPRADQGRARHLRAEGRRAAQRNPDQPRLDDRQADRARDGRHRQPGRARPDRDGHPFARSFGQARPRLGGRAQRTRHPLALARQRRAPPVRCLRHARQCDEGSVLERPRSGAGRGAGRDGAQASRRSCRISA